MRIFAINMTCERDSELTTLMQDTLMKHGAPLIKGIRSINTGGREYPRYGNGAGWHSSMNKLSAIAQYIEDVQIKDDDFLLSVDSDVVFTSPEVFEHVNTEFGIIGTMHQQPYPTKFGPWGHMSGALIFMRGDIVKAMCDIEDSELERIRFDEFKKFVIVENEDVVLSYLAKTCGAVPYDLPGSLSSGNFEHEVEHGDLKSYYHLNYSPTMFLGEVVTGKWDIPRAIRNKGIAL